MNFKIRLNDEFSTTSKRKGPNHWAFGSLLKATMPSQKEIWTVVCLTFDGEFLFSKYYFIQRGFSMITQYFLNPFSKMFCNFSLKLKLMANRRQVLFSALRDKLNKRKNKFALSVAFKR